MTLGQLTVWRIAVLCILRCVAKPWPPPTHEGQVAPPRTPSGTNKNVSKIANVSWCSWAAASGKSPPVYYVKAQNRPGSVLDSE